MRAHVRAVPRRCVHQDSRHGQAHPPPGVGLAQRSLPEESTESLMPTITAQLKTAAIRIPIGGRTWLNADIAVPTDAKGLVLFAHGSGSGRHSPRNRYVAS